MPGNAYDLLLINGHVLTMDAQSTQYEPGFVAVTGDKLVEVGAMPSCPPRETAREVIDCAGCVVMPGLINCHTHLAMSYFRGMADDLTLREWLTGHIWPAERKFLNPQFVYDATLFAAAESIRSGVTCVNDMYIFARDAARACSDAGLRAFVGEGVLDFPTAAAATPEDGKRLTEELIAEYRHHPLITPTVCAHAPYSCSPATLQMMHAVAQEHQVLFQIHLHETENEPDQIEWGKFDESPTHSLKRIGVLGPRMVAVHCVWIDDHDIHHMRELGVGVAHCPTSNMKLGSGIAPVYSMIEGELAVGVGTDGAASNNNLNLWEEIHLAAIGAKAVYKNPAVVTAPEALSFATSRAAALLDHSAIGVLAPGLQADLCVVEMGGTHFVPRYPQLSSIYSLLVYAAQAADVRDTIVAGQVLMRARQLTRLDEAELRAKAQAWVDRNFS